MELEKNRTVKEQKMTNAKQNQLNSTQMRKEMEILLR